MRRIVTVTLNAAIDTTYSLERFALGSVHRAKSLRSQAGGKGNNVARAVRRLGEDVTATGFVAGRNGQFIVDGLRAEGIRTEFAQVAEGESRVCHAFVDESSGVVTEVLEPGPNIDADDMARLEQILRGLIDPGSLVCFSGSLPRGCAISDFIGLLRMAKTRGALVAVDTSGEALSAAVREGVFLVKPNEEEARSLSFAHVGPDEERAAPDTARLLADLGVMMPVVTMGERGAVAVLGSAVYKMEPLSVSAVNPVGSGDAFLAGLLCGLARGLATDQCLALAAAAGAHNATVASAGWIDATEVGRLVREVVITRLA